MAGIRGSPGGREEAASRPPGTHENPDYDDYWHEIKDIEEDTKETEDIQDEDPSKTPDEGEQEVAWLRDAGYAHLVSKYEEGRVLEEDTLTKETASLTRTQAAAVKKRVETLNATLRQKNKPRQKQKVDVRDVFDQTSEVSSRENKASMRPGRRPSKRSESSFLKRTGGYSMSAIHFDETDSQGVETISIQSKGAPESRPANAPSAQIPTSPTDTDINLSFSLDTENISKPTNTDVVDGGLPNFVLQKDTLGVTRVSDLTKCDISKVRALALIELTALFDTNNILYARQKHKKRLKDHGIFGVPLSTLLEHDQKKYPSITVPRIFLELICFLEKTGLKEEGILRVPGSATRMKALRSEIDAKFNSDKFHWDDLMPNDAAGLMKQFIRELPAPLLTVEYLDAFAQVENVQDITQKVQALNLLVLLLPDVHRNTLQMLLTFLKKVVDEEENKMNLHNVSMIMAPNLFLVASSRRKKASVKAIEFRMAAGTSNIVRMLIKYQDLLWTVPSYIIAQIRQKYEADHLRKYREKSIMKLLGRREKADTYRKPAIHQETDYQEGVIRVLAPHMNKKYLTPIQLDSSTTANDVINKFRRWTVALPTSTEQSNGRLQSANEEAAENAGSPTDRLYLYEIGGNIGERRLDPNTHMLALLRVNPNAEWIIRVSHQAY